MTRFRMPSRRRTGPVALAAAALLMTAGLAPTAGAAGSSGAAYAWGYNNVGQAGNPAAAAYYFAVPVSDLFKDVVTVAAGDTHSLALLADGTVWAWAANNHGQLGINWATSAIATTPVRITGLPAKATAISAGTLHSLALLEDGTVWAWGSDQLGELGNDALKASKNIPVKVALPEGAKATAISAGGFTIGSATYAHSLAALEGTGKVVAWGDNTFGQLGNGAASATPSTTPVEVSNLTGVTGVAAGGAHSLALVAASKKVMAWGSDSLGALGNGGALTPVTNSAVPVETGISTATAIAAGLGHSLALLENGGVQTWGRDTEGQLGNDAAALAQASPVSAMGLTSGVVAIAAGEYHSLALLSDGTVRSWGQDAFLPVGQRRSGGPAEHPGDGRRLHRCDRHRRRSRPLARRRPGPPGRPDRTAGAGGS